MISLLLKKEELYSCESLPSLIDNGPKRRDSGYVGSMETKDDMFELFHMEM
jgi:hypothetical protein